MHRNKRAITDGKEEASKGDAGKKKGKRGNTP